MNFLCSALACRYKLYDDETMPNRTPDAFEMFHSFSLLYSSSHCRVLVSLLVVFGHFKVTSAAVGPSSRFTPNAVVDVNIAYSFA